jgi:hypothetical protein
VPLLSRTAMTSTTPPLWINQPLVLYHGTVDTHVPAILAGIDVLQGRDDTDFGRGFYTTTVEAQALAWAERLARRLPDMRPAVIRFDIDREAPVQLDCLWFVRGARNVADYWAFVAHCRTGGAAHGRTVQDGWYDVVAGPVAAVWRQRRVQPNSDQVSFHTQEAANLLNASQPRRSQ